MLRLSILLAVPAALAAQAAPNAASLEHRLRLAVRAEGRPDTALELTDRMRHYHVPGVSLAVIDNYRVVYAKGFGVTQFGGAQRVDTTTLFLAGSISKPVFATGMLRLAEERKISLDADVNQWLKAWRVPDSRFTEKEKVTLRRLLTHSAGLTVWGFPGYATDAPMPTVPQVLDGAQPANTRAVRNDTTPGARWLYSGGGFTIAQLLSTDVTGEPFPALMKRLVLQPSDMARSTYENPLPVARWTEAASGHEQTDTPVRGRFHVYPEMAAAGLWTTASDLARWAIALSHSYRGEPGGVLSRDMARQMVSNQMRQQPPYGTGYWGLGVAVSGDADSISFNHGGRDEGFVASVMMWPERGRGLVILTNGVSDALMAEVRRAFAEEYGFGAPTRPARQVTTPSPATMQSYRGRYEVTSNGQTMRLDVDVAPGGKSLEVAHSVLRRTLTLMPVGHDAFLDFESNTEVSFERAGSSPDAPVRAMAIGAGQGKRVLMRQ